MDGSDADETALLEQYGAGAIVPAEPGDYDRIEQSARTLGLIG